MPGECPFLSSALESSLRWKPMLLKQVKPCFLTTFLTDSVAIALLFKRGFNFCSNIALFQSKFSHHNLFSIVSMPRALLIV